MNRLLRLFPVWATLASLLALWMPEYFNAWRAAIFPLLMLIMFGMGMTLNYTDFRRVLAQPRLIGFGLALQYLIMPLAAYLISLALQLPLELTIGMLLVGCSAGGTASNVICYLARGNVALSITLTLASTLLAIIALPGLTWLYIGQRVPVPVLGMLENLLWLVLVPVAGGVLINTLFGKTLRPVQTLFPLLSMLAIVLVIAIIVALNRAQLANVAGILILAVILHNLLGLGAGYWLARLCKHDKVTSRTLAIEVGMQNSGLSVALATQHFTAMAALPGALFSIWHNLSGALLAGIWSRSKSHAHTAQS